jgi:hypothetical protein
MSKTLARVHRQAEAIPPGAAAPKRAHENRFSANTD